MARRIDPQIFIEAMLPVVRQCADCAGVDVVEPAQDLC